MLEIYIPTIEKATNEHADWYKNFTQAFNLCQLSNQLFISYIQSYVNDVTIDKHGNSNEYKAIRKTLKTQDKQLDFLFSLDIAEFLGQIVDNYMENVADQHAIGFQIMGLQVEGYHNKDLGINLDEIRDSTSEATWFSIMKGLLNVFEFQFLFSIVEDRLKEIVQQEKSSGIVNRALKIHPGFIDYMQNDFGLSRDFMGKLWEFFLEMRNIYAHSFGYIQELDKTSLMEKRESFIKAYNNIDIQWHITAGDIEDFFFCPETLVVGKQYLIKDKELNIFRNFTRLFMPELAKFKPQE